MSKVLSKAELKPKPMPKRLEFLTSSFVQVELKIGQMVRYKPGKGTYGYEDAIAASFDGRVPGVVVGFTATRVRVRLTLDSGRKRTRPVDPWSLIVEPMMSTPSTPQVVGK